MNHLNPIASNPLQGFHSRTARACLLALFLQNAFCCPDAWAGFVSPGQGLQVLAQEILANGALFWETKSTWTNLASPAKPYTVAVDYALPPCAAIAMGRLILTAWAGTPDYTCRLTVQINGQHLPAVAPLAFGSTHDSNPEFNLALPGVYGSGSGVWLLALPVPGGLLSRDGSANRVQITVETPDNFDGRIHQATLAAVYQSGSLHNSFSYILAEGNGDIYGSPKPPQVDARTLALNSVDPAGATAARLRVLYTYGDKAQNDRLYFNGFQFGGGDVAGYDKTVVGRDFGPDAASFDVLSTLAASNTVKFSVSAMDVPGTRETSLRPQLVILEVTHPPAEPPPALGIELNPVITWPVSTATYQLEYRPSADSGAWTPLTNLPAVLNGMNTVILPRSSPREFYQLRRTN